MTTVSEHLRALGYTSDDHDANVREALLELRHARLSLAELRGAQGPTRAEIEAREAGKARLLEQGKEEARKVLRARKGAP